MSERRRWCIKHDSLWSRQDRCQVMARQPWALCDFRDVILTMVTDDE